MVDYYKVFGFSRDEPTAAIQAQLRKLDRVWRSRAARSGSMAEKARSMVQQVSAAGRAFSSDEIRSQYDQALGASLAQPGRVAEVDWLTRAWNYYFLRDEGAAAVAARKAREQHPDDRMVYVVSAWVTLLTAGDDKDEIKRAKADADEAFVLDELGEDTADVHHVRAVAYLGLEDYDRGLVSIDRALNRAVADEKPHMYLIKSSLHQGRKEYEEMLGAAIDGLEVTSDLVEEDRRRLTGNLLAALTGLCYFPGDSSRGVAACEARAANVHHTRIPQESKDEALAMIDNLRRIATLDGVKDVDFSRPQYLWRIFGFGLVLAIFSYLPGGVGYSSSSTGVFVLGIVLVVVAAVQGYRLTVWNDNRKAYLTAREELERLESRLPRRLRAILKLRRSGQLVVG